MLQDLLKLLSISPDARRKAERALLEAARQATRTPPPPSSDPDAEQQIFLTTMAVEAPDLHLNGPTPDLEALDRHLLTILHPSDRYPPAGIIRGAAVFLGELARRHRADLHWDDQHHQLITPKGRHLPVHDRVQTRLLTATGPTLAAIFQELITADA